jgi:predicted MPP superfamily phosphohydrolase
MASIGTLATAIGVTLGLYARYIGPKRYESITLSLMLPRWPHALDGLLLALVSDIHLGYHYSHPWRTPALDNALVAVHKARPDVLVACGDFVFADWTPKEIAAAVAPFEAPIRIAALGNHDYGHGHRGAMALVHELGSVGYTVLVNEARCFQIGGQCLWFAAFDDSLKGQPNIEAVLSALPADAAPVIGVVHEPDVTLHLPPTVFDLVLSGHTHGGQIALPWFNAWLLRHWARTEFDRGLYTVNGMPLYVSKGLGMVGLPARFRARPEAVFFRLHAPR